MTTTMTNEKRRELFKQQVERVYARVHKLRDQTVLRDDALVGDVTDTYLDLLRSIDDLKSAHVLFVG